MSVHTRRNGWSSVTAISWRALAHRFSFLLFLALAVGLLIVERAHPIVIENIRTHVMDGLSPLLNAAARPLDLAQQAASRVQTYMQLQVDNELLRAENAQLRQWQNTAAALTRENQELRGLLNFKAEPKLAYITARVIADTGGPFVRSLVVTAGKVDGVSEGMAAMTGEGLIGRVVEVGDWSSRILLLTDLNSRIPVVMADSGDHAVLAGDNSSLPKLLYLPQESGVKVGQRVMTSGHGGIFPPQLPVGIVAAERAGRGGYAVTPLAALGRVTYVRLVDFNLTGGSFNRIAAGIKAETRKH